MAGDPNRRPRLFHGAFVEYGAKSRGTLVRFQFNPEELSRNRSLSFEPPNKGRRQRLTLRDFHQREKNLTRVRQRQKVTLEEETLSFDLRLDATDALGRGEGKDGIAPELTALEFLTLPQTKKKRAGGEGDEAGISFSRRAKPPLVLFVWGRRRVLPVNVTSLSIKETDFGFDLTPIRAVVSVELTVIEGPNPPYMATYKNALSTAQPAMPGVKPEEIEVPAKQAFG